MLLYWDQVSSIVPYEFIQKPEALGTYMRTLVAEGLVFQVMPGAHIHEIPRFFDAFKEYVGNLGPELNRRRRRFARGSTFRVHIEKLGKIGDFLAHERLAVSRRKPWYQIEQETADDFMSYLAASLGQVQSVDSAPVTDRRGYLPRFARAGVPKENVTLQLDSLRIQVLEKVLPVPAHTVQPASIRAFKERHHKELGDFRRRVERELIDASTISDALLRERRLEIFLEEAEVKIRELQEEMRGAGWKTARTGLSVITAIPGMSPLLGLAGAIWDAVAGGGRRQLSLDFAYAAHARSELA